MGSVGQNYKCPWCGRVDNGGYTADWGPPYPICSEGAYGCLTHRLENEQQDSLAVRVDRLNGLFQHPPPRAAALTFIAQFVVPSKWDIAEN